MKRILLLLSFTFLFLIGNHLTTNAQLPDGSTAPNWTLTDLSGNTHQLYDILDNGYTVYIDVFATWCGPCWAYHQTHAFRDLYNEYGPGGTNDVRVFGIEADMSTNEACIYGPTNCNGNTQGNWKAGVPYPIINITSSNGPSFPSDYQIAYYPTIYVICPSRTIYEAGQVPKSVLAKYINSCSFELESITGSTVPCFESNNGTVDLELTGGSTPIQYTWSNGETTEDLSGVAPGTYSVTATESMGVQVTASATVHGPSSPVSVHLVNKVDVNCNGAADGSIEVAANGGTAGYTYAWDNGDTGPLIQNLSGGSYTVTVTDANGCSKTFTESITEPPALVLDHQSIPVICENNDGQIDVYATGGVSPYTYDIGNGPQGSKHFSGLSSGTYTVTVTDDHGCTAEQSIFVDEIAPPTVILPQGPLEMPCDGSTMFIDASQSSDDPGFFFVWSTQDGEIVSGENSLIVEIGKSGTYTLTITDANTDCSRSATISVIPASNVPVADAGADKKLKCNVTQITLDGSGSSSGSEFSYQWTTSNGHIVSGATTLKPTVDAIGDYKLEVTNTTSGCSASSMTAVTADKSLPHIETSSSGNITCNSGEVTLDGTGSDSGADIVVHWYGPAGNVISDTYTATVTAAGTYKFVVENTANGCSVSEKVIVANNTDAPVIKLQLPDTLTCNKTSVRITSNGSDSGPDFQYTWSTVTGNIVGDVHASSVSVDAPGTYYLNIHNTATGCSAVDTVEVIEYINTPVAGYTQNVDGLTVEFKEDAQGDPQAYLWDFGDGSTSTKANPTHTYASDNTYEVCLTIENECGTDKVCKSIAVTKHQIVVSAQVINVNCYGGNDGEIHLTIQGGSAGYTYEWSNGMTTKDVEGLSAGEYSVVITSPSGISTTQHYTVIEPAQLNLTSGVTDVTCYGGSDGLVTTDVGGGTAPYSYLWNNGSTDSILIDVESGEYIVTITDSHGCERVFDSIYVNQPEQLSLTATVTDVSCYESNDGLVSAEVFGGTAPYSYAWSNGSVDTVLVNVPAGEYMVTITDSHGCERAFDDIQVTQPDELDVEDLEVLESAGNSSISLTVVGGTNPYSYLWSNGATTEDISGLADGDYSLEVTDAHGCVKEFGPYSIVTTSINTIDGLTQFTAYPNPVNDVLRVLINTNSDKEMDIELVNNLGEIVYHKHVTGTDIEQDIYVSHLSSGVYFIRLKTADGLATKSVLIHH